MMIRLTVAGHGFTIAGDYGDLTLYDDLGRPVATGLRTPKAAEIRAGVHAERLPPPRPRSAAPYEPTGRNRHTGY